MIESQPQSGSRKARCICDVLSAVAIVAFIAIGVTLALLSATNERKTPHGCSEDQEAVLLSCTEDCDACDAALTRLQLDACTLAGGEEARLALATACPLPVDCVGSWSAWSACSSTCVSCSSPCAASSSARSSCSATADQCVTDEWRGA